MSLFRLLIVDDSEIIRAVIKKTIKIAELPVDQIYEADNGKKALEVMDQNWIDVIFVDINMPVMNGIELVENMKKNDILKSIPVVVISTEGSQTRIQKLFEMGIKDFIRKPFTPEQIKKIINKVTENESESA